MSQSAADVEAGVEEILDHIDELADELEVSDDSKERAVEMVTEYIERELHRGKSRWGIAAAAINWATADTDEEVPKTVLADEADVSPTTIRKRVWEFDNMDEIEPGRSDRITNEELIAELNRLADEKGGRPSMGDMRRDGKYSPHTYQERFGNWTNALEAADIDLRRVRVEKLISDLQRVAEKIGRVPDVDDAGEHGVYSPQMLIRECGGWEEALEAAGLDPDGLPEDNMLADLRQVRETVQRWPTRDDMREHGSHDVEKYEQYFGGWRAAVDMIVDEEQEE